MIQQLTIAIDGYSGCGKSTIAKDLAKRLNYVFIDSGAMYRGVTLYAMQNNLIENNEVITSQLIQQLPFISLSFKITDATEKQHLYLNNVDVEDLIRRPEVAELVSKVATIKEVREKLVAEQRILGQSGGVVMDGRDIGSVVFPDAELKFFVTADPLIRAKRRLEELNQKNIDSTVEEVMANLLERDEMDRSRKESPLIQVPEAILIDTSNHTRETQLEEVLQHLQGKFCK
mgnify:CR=1 FL=1